MDLFDKNNIVLEKDLDGKGMQNDESQIPFFAKAKEAICLIKYKDKCGTGFFCNISGVTFLITNNHVYPQNSEITDNCIDITINGKLKIINLEGRGKWTNSEMDFTFIEIKKEDNIKTPFSLVDNILKSNYSNENYINSRNVTAFALNKYDKFKLYYSYGYIQKSGKSSFTHTCNTYSGCSGGCIVIQNTNHVIGIHRAGHKNGEVNVGIFINDVIKNIKKQVNHYSYN